MTFTVWNRGSSSFVPGWNVSERGSGSSIWLEWTEFQQSSFISVWPKIKLNCPNIPAQSKFLACSMVQQVAHKHSSMNTTLKTSSQPKQRPSRCQERRLHSPPHAPVLFPPPREPWSLPDARACAMAAPRRLPRHCHHLCRAVAAPAAWAFHADAARTLSPCSIVLFDRLGRLCSDFLRVPVRFWISPHVVGSEIFPQKKPTTLQGTVCYAIANIRTTSMATIYNVVHVTDMEYKRTLGLPLEVGTHDRKKNVEIKEYRNWCAMFL